MIAAAAAIASFSGHQLAARPLITQPLAARPLATRARPTQLLDVGTFLYEAQITADALVQQQFQQLTPASALVLYAAGLLTSLTPCCLAMLPLTIGFIGGLEEEAAATADCCTDGGAAPAADGAAAVAAAAPAVGGGLLVPAAAFAAGLSCALTAFGVAASSFGALYGSVGDGALASALPVVLSLLICGMGLNLLKVLPFELPSLALDNVPGARLPPAPRAFLFGASTALVSSPCATPVLVSILGFVAATGDPALGAGLLLAYTLGYTTPVLAAGVATGSAKKFAAMRSSFEWVTPASGSLLLGYGTYQTLVGLFGAV